MSKRSLLLVDGDAQSLRVLEVSLRKAGFVVTTAVNGRDGLDKARSAKPDLILCETEMPEMDGFELCRELKGDQELAAIPFVFLTSQVAIENKIRGLELGVDEYLTKPIYIKEVLTRIRLILQKKQRASIETRRDSNSRFAGSLHDMGVLDLIQTVEVGRKSGLIHFNAPDGRQATIYFRNGVVIDAEAGHLQGADAVYRLLTWSEGEFELLFRTVRRKDSIETATPALLMEGMRRLDEWGRLLEQLPPLSTRFEVDVDRLAERLAELPDNLNHILRLFDGRRTLVDVIDLVGVSDLECIELVSRLYFEELLREVDGGNSEAEVTADHSLSGWLGRQVGAPAEPSAVELAPESATDAAAEWDAAQAEPSVEEVWPGQTGTTPVSEAADEMAIDAEEPPTPPSGLLLSVLTGSMGPGRAAANGRSLGRVSLVRLNPITQTGDIDDGVTPVDDMAIPDGTGAPARAPGSRPPAARNGAAGRDGALAAPVPRDGGTLPGNGREPEQPVRPGTPGPDFDTSDQTPLPDPVPLGDDRSTPGVKSSRGAEVATVSGELAAVVRPPRERSGEARGELRSASRAEPPNGARAPSESDAPPGMSSRAISGLWRVPSVEIDRELSAAAERAELATWPGSMQARAATTIPDARPPEEPSAEARAERAEPLRAETLTRPERVSSMLRAASGPAFARTFVVTVAGATIVGASFGLLFWWLSARDEGLAAPAPAPTAEVALEPAPPPVAAREVAVAAAGSHVPVESPAPASAPPSEQASPKAVAVPAEVASLSGAVAPASPEPSSGDAPEPSSGDAVEPFAGDAAEPPAGDAPADAVYEQLYDEARRARRDRDYEAVLDFASRAGKQRQTAQILTLEAEALLQLGSAERALVAADAAVVLKPRYAQAWYIKGRAHQALGQRDRAREALKQYLLVDPEGRRADQVIDLLEDM